MLAQCILVFITSLLVSSVIARPKSPDPFIQSLFDLIKKNQFLKDESYRTLRSWEKVKGLYSSSIRFNFHGKFPSAELRRLFEIYDNNIFVGLWVTTSLLESFIFGGTPGPTHEQLMLAVDVTKGFQDKNKHYNTSVLTFWEQKFNKSVKYWHCSPTNLLQTLSFANSLPLDVIKDVANQLGLQQLAEFIEFFMERQATFTRALHIPPDFDDTFVNIGLGSLLYHQKHIYPDAWSLWSSLNNNITSVFDALKQYAYRPFSHDPNTNTIDPRTYYHIRGFLDQAKANGQDVALVTTWAQNIEETRQEFYKGVGMPYSVNNVDVTVCANTIFGITSAVLTGLVSVQILEDPLIAKIYVNTSSLIAYEINTNFSGRPDLALTYYPSKMEFYWFTARTKALLETVKRKNVLYIKVMEEVYNILKSALEGNMTQHILATANKEEADLVYFDDFLGNADLSLSGEPVKRGEDRIFTTAMAANALLSTWTFYDEHSEKSYWKKGTPKDVPTTVAGSIKWLRLYSLDNKYKPWNAFFSGSTKGFKSLPFWYPGNRFEYLNGTRISDYSKLPAVPFIYSVEGYIPQEEYKDMLKESHFGVSTPTTFDGYNNGSTFFPFWSSDSYTYSVTLLAVSRFDNIVR